MAESRPKLKNVSTGVSRSTFLNHPKYLSRLWAALNIDFDNLGKLYLKGPRWNFQHFANCCRHQHITLIMNATLSHGKGYEEYYNKTTNLILQTAKSIWLNPYPPDYLEVPTVRESKLNLKRRIFGFFLTYLMYMKQPYQGRVKIVLGIKDLEYAVIWKKEIKTTEVQEEIEFILKILASREAFQFQLTSELCGLDAETRHLMAARKSETIPLTREMQFMQDEIITGELLTKTLSVNVDYNKRKVNFGKRMDVVELSEAEVIDVEVDEKEGTVESRPTVSNAKSFDKSKTQDLLTKFNGGKELKKCIEKLAKLTDKPVVTIENFNTTETINQLIMETSRRFVRRKKVTKKSEDDSIPKVNHPYMEEGGIFSRRNNKEYREEKEDKTEGDQGFCSENLWAYINGKKFGEHDSA